MEKTEKMNNFLDNLSQFAYGNQRSTSMKNKKCVSCSKDVDPNSFKDEISKREYEISGMCQECQDKFFCPDEEDLIGFYS